MAADEETETSEEDVPRFGLRRGARFLETLREETGSGDADDQWIADLRPDCGDDPDGDDEGDSHSADLDEDADRDSPESHLADPSHAAPEPTTVEPTDAEPAGAEAPGAEPAGAEAARARPTGAGATGQVETPSSPSVLALVTTLVDAMATLEERLLVLEEALAKATAACTVSRMVLQQAARARGHADAPAVEDDKTEVQGQD